MLLLIAGSVVAAGDVADGMLLPVVLMLVKLLVLLNYSNVHLHSTVL